ncbi:MAG TPA: hypothetical protein VH109_14625 [Steroidobacteraceae bacterium]|jgi:hypothetical protein|nr:hypothetical protein [Steroidobacteraceae bacterium]
MGTLSEWLRLMLGEIARKESERASARAEEERRRAEQAAAPRRARGARPRRR